MQGPNPPNQPESDPPSTSSRITPESPFRRSEEGLGHRAARSEKRSVSLIREHSRPDRAGSEASAAAATDFQFKEGLMPVCATIPQNPPRISMARFQISCGGVWKTREDRASMTCHAPCFSSVSSCPSPQPAYPR